MEYRSYKMRGSPDCPISVHLVTTLPQSFIHYHPEPEIILVLEGSLRVRLEKSELILQTGDIFIINPNQLHGIRDSSPDHVSISLIFSVEAITTESSHIFQTTFVQPLQDGNLQFPTLLQPGHPAYEEVYRCLQPLRQFDLSSDYGKLRRYRNTVDFCVALMPYCITTETEDRRQSPDDATVKKVMSYLRNRYTENLTLEQIANYVHLHPNYLCTLFKTYTGQTVLQQLIQLRVEAAEFLLRRDDLPMERVAELSGFSNARAFYRHFKDVTGMTPKAYQRQQQT